MKYYAIKSHYEKEAPFEIAWQVKLFDEHILLEEHNHIYCNEIAGYCKCLEDMGFIEKAKVKNDIQKEPSKSYNAFGKTTMTDKEINDLIRMCMEPMICDLSKNLFDSINF